MRRRDVMYFLAYFVTSTAVAQSCLHTGTLTGLVVDQTGAVIGNTRVETSIAGGVRSANSGKDGRWTISCLVSGFHRIQVNSPGFKRAEVESFQVVSEKTTSLRPSF